MHLLCVQSAGIIAGCWADIHAPHPRGVYFFLFFKVRFIYFHFTLTGVLPAYVSVHHIHTVPLEVKRGCQILGTGSTDGS